MLSKDINSSRLCRSTLDQSSPYQQTWKQVDWKKIADELLSCFDQQDSRLVQQPRTAKEFNYCHNNIYMYQPIINPYHQDQNQKYSCSFGCWLVVWGLWCINLYRLFNAKFCLYVYTFNQRFMNKYLVNFLYEQDFICLHMINQF